MLGRRAYDVEAEAGFTQQNALIKLSGFAMHVVNASNDK
jgi:hypothetical protein